MNGKGLWLTLAFLCLLALTATPAQAQWCQGIDGPYWCGDPEACQGVCSDPNSDCMTPCKRFNNWSTCGGITNDHDGDGVGNGSDNCACNANSNQADCDLDGFGDVCDGNSVRWVYVQDMGRCDWDGDTNFGSFDVEILGAHQYQDACSGNYCADRYVIDQDECNWGTQTYSTDTCCEALFNDSWCIHGNCGGGSNCPF